MTARSNGMSETRRFWTALLRHPLGGLGLVVLAVILLAAAIGPLLVTWDPTRADTTAVLLPPDAAHLLGTDASGRDILARLLAGSRLTLAAATIVVVVALGIGVPVGLLAGYLGGWVDATTSWIASMTLSLPNMVVVLAVVTILGPDTYVSMTVFGILFSVGPFRLTRSTVRAVRNELFVDAARVSGVSEARIVFRHVLSSVRGPVIVQAATIAGIAIVLQAGLDFLGIGDRTQPTWGSMLSEAFVSIYRAPLNILWPGLAIGATGAALSLLANAMRDLAGHRAPAPRRRGRASAEVSGAADGIALSAEALTVAVTDGHGDRTVVDHVDLTVARGEVVGLVGTSGSGKSQTALAILGLLPSASRVIDGRVTLHGADAPLRALRGHRIGYIPQEPIANLDPSFTVGSQLVEPLRRHLRMTRKEARQRALELLGHVGIADPERTFRSYPHQISGGMAQRVLIAAAISCDPDVLIADEPTTALDVTVQAGILDLLRQLREERGLAILLITHNIGVVADLCDRVAVMSAGSIVEEGSTRAVLTAPHHPATIALLEASLETAPSRTERDGRLA